MNLYLPINTAINFPELEKASLIVYSLTYSKEKNVTKIGSFSFLRRPDHRFWKLRIISLSPKRLWISVSCSYSLADFDLNTINFEEKSLYRVLISVTPSVFRIRKISDYRKFSGSSSGQSICKGRDHSFT